MARSQMFAALVEQQRLLGSTDQSARKSPRLNTSVLIEFAKIATVCGMTRRPIRMLCTRHQ